MTSLRFLCFFVTLCFVLYWLAYLTTSFTVLDSTARWRALNGAVRLTCHRQ